MPEGDTIHRAATRLKPVLEGQTLERSESRVLGAIAASLAGHTVNLVEARGKHLLFHFDDGRVLHSHMGMTGSWHIYRRNEKWQKPVWRAAIVLDSPLHTVVCFTPKTLELLSAAQLRRHPYLPRLGPDLLAAPPDDAEVLRRYRACNSLSIGEAILNQTIVSGVGNVYKSEVLFLLHVHPRVPVKQLSDEQLLAITTRSRELMERNLDGRPRTTRNSLDGRRLWVYGRKGQPCFVCGHLIEMIRQGDAGRSTYFCESCQPLTKSPDRAETS